MQQVIEKLNVKSALSKVVEQRLSEFWKYCIEEMRDEAVRASVIAYLENTAPVEFFYAPASPSGKHHPVWQNEPGGILRNTVECCLFIDVAMAQEWQLTDDTGSGDPKNPYLCEPDRSIIYAATILSDTCKGGYPWGPKTDYRHGQIAADLWKPFGEKLGVSPRAQELIYEATYWHLGRWTPGWTEEIGSKFSVHTNIVHALDALCGAKNLEKIFIPRSLPM